MPSDDGLSHHKFGHNISGNEILCGTNQAQNKHERLQTDHNADLETAISSSLTHLRIATHSPFPNSLRNNNYCENDISYEVVGHVLESLDFPGRSPHYSKIKICCVASIVETRKRDKGGGYLKMADRQVANPFRRYGSLKMLHNVGGWVTPKGTDKRNEYVKTGSRAPKKPSGPEFGLHKDVNLNKEVISFSCPKTSISSDAILSVAQQIKTKVQSLEPDLTQKPSDKKQGPKPRKESHNISHNSTASISGIIRKRFSH